MANQKRKAEEKDGKSGDEKSRQKVDLYEDKQTEKVVRQSAEKLSLRVDEISKDLEVLTDLLEAHREQVFSSKKESEEVKAVLNGGDKTVVMDFLKQPNLLNRINH